MDCASSNMERVFELLQFYCIMQQTLETSQAQNAESFVHCWQESYCNLPAAPGLKLVLADLDSNISTLKNQAIGFLHSLLAGFFFNEINKAVTLHEKNYSKNYLQQTWVSHSPALFGLTWYQKIPSARKYNEGLGMLAALYVFACKNGCTLKDLTKLCAALILSRQAKIGMTWLGIQKYSYLGSVSSGIANDWERSNLSVCAKNFPASQNVDVKILCVHAW